MEPTEDLPTKRIDLSSEDESKPTKKPKILPAYLNTLPSSPLYEKSYMHKAYVTQIAISTSSEFIATGSADGFVNLWKKQWQGIEFVKKIQAHKSEISCLAMSHDGLRLISSGKGDNTIKVFDVMGFDMIDIIRLDFCPTIIEFVNTINSPCPLVALGGNDKIQISKIGQESNSIKTIAIHNGNIKAIKFNHVYSTVISIDDLGFIEYWDVDTGETPEDIDFEFKFKTQTDLFELAKLQTYGTSLTISPNGKQFAIFCKDRVIRLFDFLSGNLLSTFDEKIEKYQEIQATPNSPLRLERLEFHKRMAIERDIDKDPSMISNCITFDESNEVLLYSTYIGIKFILISDGSLLKLLGKEESERFTNISLYQGKPMRNMSGKAGAGGSTSQGEKEIDPLAICSAYKTNRFYLFSKREPTDVETEKNQLGRIRDIVNEQIEEEQKKAMIIPKSSIELPHSAVIHTTVGDIYIKLFPEECPKTVENFAVHTKNGYYNQLTFHRVLKGFMIQTGDPKGDGSGGESIWGEEFEDEINENLKHDRPFTVSMANRGPNTNGSQFFITTVPASWLNGRHTLFGRVYKGMDVVLTIEGVPCDKNKIPLAEIRITQIDLNT